MRNEFKIGLCFLVIFGLIRVFFNAPEFILGFLSILGISLVIVGSLSDDSYQRLKSKKRSSRSDRL